MTENRIEAVHNPGGGEEGNGVWVFTCHAHDPGPKVMQTVSAPKHAVEVMQAHCDAEHPGVPMNLSRDSMYSGSYWGSYTGKAKAP